MLGAIAFDMVTGALGGLTLFGLDWAEADGKNIEIPQYTRDVLRLGFWHPAVWILPRCVLAWRLHKGSAAGRAVTIAVEALAVAAWAPTLFIWVDGGYGVVQSYDFGPLRVCAAVCAAASIAVIVLLCTPAVRAWCARRPAPQGPGPGACPCGAGIPCRAAGSRTQPFTAPPVSPETM